MCFVCGGEKSGPLTTYKEGDQTVGQDDKGSRCQTATLVWGRVLMVTMVAGGVGGGGRRESTDMRTK